MTIRSTHEIAAAQLQRAVSRSFGRLSESQLKIASGKRFSRPSESPGESARLLFFKQRARELEQFRSNIAEGETLILSTTDTLQAASEVAISARELIIQGLNGTLSPSDRQTIGTSLGQKLDELLALANSRLGNRQIFAGTATSTPFVSTTDASGQQVIQYRGNDDSIVSEVGPGVTAAINLPGSRIFLNDGRGTTTFEGTTGAAPGPGTDSGRGVDRLQVRHTGTVYASGGGLAPGTSSVGGDTVIGNRTIALNVGPTGVTGTVSLNGGPAIPFLNPNTDLQVTGPNGEVLNIDVSGVTPSFNGNVLVVGNGELSTDGGATGTPITFSANQQVRDSVTGDILNVDTTGITSAGTEIVSYGGTLDLFSSLIAIRDVFTGDVSSGNLADDLARASSYLGELDAAHDHLLQALGNLGGQETRLTAAGNRLTDVEIRIRDLISKTEDVDISEAVIDLEQNETAYQSALLVTSRVNELSLLNFV